MSVRASPISRTAAILIIALGVFTLVGGYLADVFIDEVAGLAFILLGVVLYRLLYVITERFEAEVAKADEAQGAEVWMDLNHSFRLLSHVRAAR